MKKTKLIYIGNILSSHGRTPSTIETLGPCLENEGFKVVYAGKSFNKLKRLLEMITLTLKNYKDSDYVLIDTYSGYAFYYTLAVSFICNILKIKYIPILHGGDLPTRLKKSPKSSDYIFKNSFINVAVSDYLKNAFSNMGYKTVIIENNIELKDYSYQERTNLKPKLFWVRSFHKDYNPKMAIEVLNNLLNDHGNAELCMIGPDKDGSFSVCKDYAKELGISESVKFYGKLNKSQWHKISENYDIYINTTNYDNLPVSVLEIMALGLPIVSTNVGGLSYFLKHEFNALLVDKANSEQMTKAINLLLKDNKLAKKLTQNAKAQIKNYDWESVRVKWFKILK